MTKVGNENKEWQDAVNMGKRNKELIPKVKNWCKHIVLEDVSGGMIAAMHNLPITLKISCPHTIAGFQAMNLEWNASDFIKDNCQKCKHHKEIFKPNFGTEVIEKLNKQKEEKKKLEQDEKEKKLALKKQIDRLFQNDRDNSKVTELSVLKLIQSLEESEGTKNNATKILEASKLSPEFFNSIALDYLCLHYEHEDISEDILLSTLNIIKSKGNYSPFFRERINDLLEKNIHIDLAVGILHLIVEGKELEGDFSIVKQIVNSLSYDRNFRDPYESRPTYPNVTSFLVDIYKKEPNNLYEVIHEQLKINDKRTRVNTNYLLHELIESNPSVVLPHCQTIIASLELEDDQYTDSADVITCITLAKLFSHYPDIVLKEVTNQHNKLSIGAKKELIRFYEDILLRENYADISPTHTEEIIGELIRMIHQNGISSELREESLSVLAQTSWDKTESLLKHTDNIIGFYVQQIKDYKTFKWHLEELKNEERNISTFNPLLGKNYLEIQSEQLKIKRSIRDTESIVQNLISHRNNEEGFHRILDLLKSLNSSSDGTLKSKLIGIIRESKQETIRLGAILPTIHGFLLDIESKDIRFEAVKFVKYLIEEHSQLVTQTLIDLIKAFLDDPEVLVKGSAISTYGAIIRKFPEHVQQEQITYILNELLNSFVYIQKNVARLSYKLFPFLTESQKLLLIHGILIQEEYYYQQNEIDYCKELIDILLFLTKENSTVFPIVVTERVVKYCNHKNYYTAVDFLEKLTQIRNQYEEFSSVWLKQFLTFLSNTTPDFNGFDKRKEMFTTVYNLPEKTILNQIGTIKKLVNDKIESKQLTDTFELLSILAYFGFYETLNELSAIFSSIIEMNNSNNSVLEFNKKFFRISNLENKVHYSELDQAFINSLFHDGNKTIQ